MNKRIFALLIAVLLCIVSVAPVFATSEQSRVVDNADVLTDSEEADLVLVLDEISERQQFNVSVAVVDTLDGYTIQEYADDFYDYYGYGNGSNYDGCVLLVAMEEREWYISTSGFGITALTDYGIDYIGEQIIGDLGNGYYYDAFVTYAELCDEFVTQAYNGTPFDVDTAPKGSFNFFKSLLISVLIGAVVALIATLIMKGQLKSVRFKSEASDYEKAGSMVVTDSREYFLYSNVTRVKKAENNSGGSSTHTSSSGRTHGGGGGSF